MRRRLAGKLSGLAIFFGGLFISTGAVADGGPIVALFDMEDKGSGLEKQVIGNLVDYLAARLTEGGYQIVPPEQIRLRIRSEKKESYKSCFDQGCQIELGRELSAQKTLATKILRIGDTCQVTAVMYDLKRAATERAATAESKCEVNQLLGAVKQIASNLGGSMESTRKVAAQKEASLTPTPAKSEAPETRKEALPQATVPEAPAGNNVPVIASIAAPAKPMHPYVFWGHVSFWSGVGFAALGGASAVLSKKAGDEYGPGDLAAKDRSRVWAGVMYGSLGAGVAAIATGIVLWIMKPSDSLSSESLGVVTPTPDARGMVFMWTGRW